MSRKINVKRQLTVGIFLIILVSSLSSASQLSNNNNFSTNDELPSIPLTGRKTIYVDDDNTEGPWDGTKEHPFQFIRDGINAADWHDTVYVFSGTYYERITIDHAYFKLIGENKRTTIIDGGKKGTVITIKGFAVEIKGFTIKNSREDPYSYGIFVYNTDEPPPIDSLIIENNIISDNEIGIYIYDVDNEGKIYNNKITRNTIINNNYGISLNGYVFGSNKNIIELNEIRDNRIIGVEICGMMNIVKKNNFINNTKNAFFYGLRTLLNRWDSNYWDDWTGTGPYVINGEYFNEKPLKNYDFHPAEEPYDITNVEEINLYENTHSRYQSTNLLFFRLLERFPNLFPILQTLLLQRLGLQ